MPQRVEIPKGVPVTIQVTNSSSAPIEFESFKLNCERVIKPGRTAAIVFPALRAGRYDFYDDFHDDVPEGVIVIR